MKGNCAAIMALGTAAFAVASPVCAKPASSALWVEARSKHFVVRSNAGEKRAREIAGEFERIRAVFHAAVLQPDAVPPRDPRLPVTILAAADEATFASLLPPEWAAEGVRRPPGFFLKTPERYYVVLRADLRGEQAYHLVYHEYFHVFASLNLPPAPLWLSEGLADFYASTALRPAGQVRGGGMLRHKLLLRGAKLIPLRDLLSATKESNFYTDPAKASLFYAQAWALVHLLELGGPGGGAHRAGSARDLLRQGMQRSAPPEQIALLEQELAAYVRRGSYPALVLEQVAPPPDAEVTTRALTAAEAGVGLAEYLFAAKRWNEAKQKIDSILRDAPGTPGAADLIGQWLLARNDAAGAWAELSRAAHQGSTDWRTYYTLAMLTAQRAKGPQELRIAEDCLRRAVELNADSAEAAAALAGLLLDRKGELALALSLARRAEQLQPEKASHSLLTVRALLLSEQRAEAERHLSQAQQAARTGADRALLLQYSLDLQQAQTPAHSPALAPSGARELIYWVKDEAAEEALRRWKAERDAVAHVQTFVSGRVMSVACPVKPRLNLELETEAGTLKLLAENSGLVAYYVTEGTPPKVFDPCRGLRGKSVDVVYRPTPKGAAAAEILAIEMRD